MYEEDKQLEWALEALRVVTVILGVCVFTGLAIIGWVHGPDIVKEFII